MKETLYSYITLKAEFESELGTFRFRITNRSGGFVLRNGESEIRDNLFSIDLRQDLYKMIPGIYDWLLEIKEVLEAEYVKKGATKMSYKLTVPKYIFTENTFGVCTLTFHKKYKNSLDRLELVYPLGTIENKKML